MLVGLFSARYHSRGEMPMAKKPATAPTFTAPVPAKLLGAADAQVKDVHAPAPPPPNPGPDAPPGADSTQSAKITWAIGRVGIDAEVAAVLGALSSAYPDTDWQSKKAVVVTQRSRIRS